MRPIGIEQLPDGESATKTTARAVHRIRLECRVCGAKQLRRIISLGPTPLANSFVRSAEEFTNEPSYPLDVYFCGTCSLVQLLDVIDPEVLFGNYIYLTGTSETIAKHNIEYVRTVDDLVNLRPTDLVVEVASNDGSLLKCFEQYGVRTLGVEPAANIAQMACANGVNTINRFFNSATALEMRNSYGAARIVIANNVLAHVDDPLDFLHGCRELIDKDGLIVIEVPYLRNLIEGLEYDTIYHEHLCYFSINTLCRLGEAVGLVICRVDRVSVHGGSVRIYAGLRDRYGNHAQEALTLAEEEIDAGLTEFARYERFAADVEQNRRALVSLLETLRREEKTIAGYGAPAKGNTLLNYCRIDKRLVAFTVDKNPLKIGLYTPGMHLAVLPVSTLLERQPDYVLILAWNFAEEIISQQSEYRARGGQFIIPFPEAKVV
jgi:SAM-dependent methyltransferase